MPAWPAVLLVTTLLRVGAVALEVRMATARRYFGAGSICNIHRLVRESEACLSCFDPLPFLSMSFVDPHQSFHPFIGRTDSSLHGSTPLYAPSHSSSGRCLHADEQNVGTPTTNYFPSLKTRVLEILPPRRRHSGAEDGTLDIHVDGVERIHQVLDPDVVDVHEELPDGFFRGRGGGIRRRCRGSRAAASADEGRPRDPAGYARG